MGWRVRTPSMSEATEADLLEAAQAGDRRAFSRLVRLHQRRVYACAVSMLGDGGDADDAVQETFMRAWRAIARFDGRSQLSTWLYRVCVNVCLNHIRKRKRHDAADIAWHTRHLSRHVGSDKPVVRARRAVFGRSAAEH